MLIHDYVSRRFAGGERGSILILSVLSALIIIGSAGLAVDVGRLYATKAELNRTVDAAALAGVLEFNGSAAGLTSAGDKAETYLRQNEDMPVTRTTGTPCTLSAPTAACVVADGTNSTLRINARKETRLYFLPIFGLNTATVSAKAASGFNDQTLDAVMVIDSTFSMYGTPFNNAKTAAINFKNTLLGTNPSGNVAVGVAPFRGCYKPTPITLADCIDNSTQVQSLIYDSAALTTRINSLAASVNPTSSATNVCTGLGKGYSVLVGSGSHSGPNNRKFLVLLSDGDNVYFGTNVYQAAAYPFTYQVPVAGTNYACQPPNTCTGWGSPCQNGTWPGASVTVASDGFESTNLSGGTGWTGNWIPSGSPLVSNSVGTPVAAGSYHLRLRSADSVYRQVNLAGVTSASLTYSHKQASFESGDNVLVQCSTSTGGPWTQLHDWNTTNTTYAAVTVALPPACVNSATVYIRFFGSMGDTSDQFYLDAVTVANTGVTRDGYLDGLDGQDYASCTETPKPRERQLDVQTLNLANAIKAQGVEIFVVAFSICPNADGNTIYNAAGSTTCSSQSNPVSSVPASGRVGDTTVETTANTRLAKCIASSHAGTNDHFWYATDATQLPGIFTTIAAQIAHRIIE